MSFIKVLLERVLSIGFNKDHDELRDKHRQEMHDMISSSYVKAGGYLGHTTGSKEESDAIHHDINGSNIKAVRRNGKISAVMLYKEQHGRKAIAGASDGSHNGKKDFALIAKEDNRQKRSWTEVSHGAEKAMNALNVPKIANDKVEYLTGKKIVPDADGVHYTRQVGGDSTKPAVRKVAFGHPKI